MWPCCYYRRDKRGALAAQVLVPRRCLRVWFDFGASVALVLELTLVPDTALALTSCVASVLLWDTFGGHFSANLNWTAVSFMVAFPLQNAIKEAYKRRESALEALVVFRAVLLNVYIANACWDWPGAEAYNGRSEDNRRKDDGGVGMKKKPCDRALSPEHSERVKKLAMRALDALQELLLVPRQGHARGEFWCGRMEQLQVGSALIQGREAVIRILARLHLATEDVKAAGMPANEASRINQYNMILVKEFEKLWVYKTYYTNIALRAMLRVIIQILPFFYGPYWVHIAKGNSGKTSIYTLMFACAFSMLISLLLIGMVNLEEQIENPFRHGNRDTIRVKEEIELCKESIKLVEEDLKKTWHQKVLFEWEIIGHQDSDTSSEASSALA